MDAEVEAAVRAALDELARAGATHRQGVAAQHEIRDRDLLPRLHRRGVVEPGALRRRSLRPPRGRTRARWRRCTRGRAAKGSAPSRSAASCWARTCCAPATTRRTTARRCARAASSPTISRRRSRAATRSSRRRRRCRRSSSASAWATRCRCTSPTCSPSAPEPGRRPGAVAAVRLHQGRAADRPADHRARAGRGDLLPRRGRLRGAHRSGTSSLPPEAAVVTRLRGRHRPRGARAARDAVEDLLLVVGGVRRRAQHRRPIPSAWACPGRCRC